MNGKFILIVVILLLAACCCLAVVCLVGGGVAALGFNQNSSGSLDGLLPTLRESFPTDFVDPFGTQDTGEATPVPELNTQPLDPGAEETLHTLEDEIVPNNDPRDLGLRLAGIADIPETLETPPQVYAVGDRQTFWVSNVDTNENFQVETVLEYKGDSLYFWVESGVEFNQDDLDQLAGTFEDKIYPTDREFFGSEWNPGIDNDPHLYIVYARGLGSNLAGYFSSADSVHPLAHEYSNAHEMFLLNADNVILDEDFTYGVLADEFQHMIHWYRDRNEESWMNEGFSELAAFLNGYDVGGFDYLFASNPDLQLNDWPNDSNATSPHYGAGFMFLTYFLDRFGEDATKALVADPANGMDSIDGVLAQLDIQDPQTGQVVGADDVFADWVVTNYLMDGSVGDGRYIYHNYPGAPQTYDTDSIQDCTNDQYSSTVSQYGADYIYLDCSGNYTLNFSGSSDVGVLPMDAYSGDYAFWSNKGDESDMTLTQTFDFSDVSGPISISYQTWYDAEEDYDYVYLVASVDGETWQILDTPSGTDEDPSGNSYGWGYNGVSDGWIEEEVDLSQFAGQQVQLRFEYVTDAAVNGEGFLLDDVAIPAIGYSTDFEQDDGGWNGEGFVRIQNRLPQTYRVSVIQFNGQPSVESYTVLPNQPLTVSMNGRATMVVSGTTRFTRQPASYRISFVQ
ncbi:MAG: immune inhibitor A [Anaerolineaceae bacterium]|nr:immune inhibitor A [Anaerolineaceae bacterium]